MSEVQYANTEEGRVLPLTLGPATSEGVVSAAKSLSHSLTRTYPVEGFKTIFERINKIIKISV